MIGYGRGLRRRRRYDARPMNTRSRVSLVLSSAALAAFAIAGCGGSSSSGGDDPASLAPAGSPLFVEASVKPEGDLKANIEELSKNLAGISDPGSLIVSQIDSGIEQSGSKMSFEDDVEPWLGEKAGVFFQRYDGADFSGVGAVVQTTDTAAAGAFVDKLAQDSDSPVTQGSYEGSDYTTDTEDGTSVGVVGDFLVLAEDKQTFESVVDTSKGDSLADESKYTDAVSNAPDNSLADAYVNIGALISSAGDQVDQQTLDFYNSLGYDLNDSTALASVVAGSDQVEIDLSTDAGGGIDASGLTDFIGSFPAGSWATFASPDVGEQAQKIIDSLDQNGIPGSIPPGKFKSALAQQGIDVDRIVSAIGDVGLFVEGTSRAELGGALVIEAKDPAAAKDALGKLTGLLRSSGTTGFEPIPGGFSIRDPQQLGQQAVEVVAKGDRIVFGYGEAATQQALTGSGQTLDSSAAFDAANKALGGTDLAGYVDIATVLKLAESMGASSDANFEQARPYLEKLDFAAIGADASGDLTTSKIVLKVGG
jgi:hypothetical protein